MENYRFEWYLLLAAILVSGGSLYLDLQITLETSDHMFMRSGAIVVLLSALVEYRTSAHILKDIHRAARLNKGKDLLIDCAVDEQPLFNNALKTITELAPRPTRERKLLSRYAHFLMLLGTIVWGYADFWV